MDKNEINNLIKDVEEGSRHLLKDKLLKVFLYGSYARGSFDAESDIDFALLSDIFENNVSLYNDEIGKLTSKLSIKYGIVVSIIIVSAKTFNIYKDVIPFYKSIIAEGKVLYG